MENSIIYSLVSVFLVSLLSFIGLFVFIIKESNLNRYLIYFISLAAGALFGDVFIHLLPEISRETGFTLQVSLSLLGGVLLFFILEKIIHSQHYHQEKDYKHNVRPVAYMSLLVVSFHNFLDGLMIASAYLINIPAGIATTIAVMLHEIPHKFGSFSILLHGGFTKWKALFMNFISALCGIFGVILAFSIENSLGNLTSILTPIAAGGLLYIAGSDLIPELHREYKGVSFAILQVIFFILGIISMVALLLIG